MGGVCGLGLFLFRYLLIIGKCFFSGMMQCLQRFVRLLGNVSIILINSVFMVQGQSFGKDLEKLFLVVFISRVLQILLSREQWLFSVQNIIILMDGMMFMNEGDMKFICRVNSVLLMFVRLVVRQNMNILNEVMLQLENCMWVFWLCMVIRICFSLVF